MNLKSLRLAILRAAHLVSTLPSGDDVVRHGPVSLMGLLRVDEPGEAFDLAQMVFG
jgi:hypothetical protein